MFSHNGKISVRQTELLLILEMFNTTILIAPRILGGRVGRDAYILPIVAILLGVIYTLCISGLTKRFSGDTIVEFLPKIVPNVVAYIILALFAIKILLCIGLELRMFSEIVAQVLLPKTPMPVIMITMLLAVSYLVKSGIEATGRMAEILVYFIFIPLFILFANVTFRADYKELMPFFQLNMSGFWKGVVESSFIFSPIEFMLLGTGLMKKPEKARRAMLVAVIIIGILEAIIILLTFAGTGFYEAVIQVWPVLTLMQSIQPIGGVVENHEILMMTGWIFSIFIYISAGIYFLSLIGSRWCKFKRENLFVLPVLPLIYFIASYPNNLVDVYRKYILFQRYFGLWFLLFIPLILLLIAKGRGKQNE